MEEKAFLVRFFVSTSHLWSDFGRKYSLLCSPPITLGHKAAVTPTFNHTATCEHFIRCISANLEEVCDAMIKEGCPIFALWSFVVEPSLTNLFRVFSLMEWKMRGAFRSRSSVLDTYVVKLTIKSGWLFPLCLFVCHKRLTVPALESSIMSCYKPDCVIVLW